MRHLLLLYSSGKPSYWRAEQSIGEIGDQFGSPPNSSFQHNPH